MDYKEIIDGLETKSVIELMQKLGADRYIESCKKKNIQIDDFCEIECKPVNEKIVDLTLKRADSFLEKKKRIAV